MQGAADDRRVLAVLRELLPEADLQVDADLGHGEGHQVLRLAATLDGQPMSLIAKTYRPQSDEWLREAAALSVLPLGVTAPRLIAESKDMAVIVMSDLGTGMSVADHLLGADPVAAENAVVAWAVGIARLHVATQSSRKSFQHALAARARDGEIDECVIPSLVRSAVRSLDATLSSLGIRSVTEGLSELAALPDLLGTGPTALTPADACPDNNILGPEGVMLLDFADAQWRHIAWDIAYLWVPWPTCWCSWQLPRDVTDRAWHAYLEVASAAIPGIDDSLSHAVDIAALGWELMSTTWFLGSALGADPLLHMNAPTRRAMICHRLMSASGNATNPGIAELAEKLLHRLRRVWGDVRPGVAPAFAGPRT